MKARSWTPMKFCWIYSFWASASFLQQCSEAQSQEQGLYFWPQGQLSQEWKVRLRPRLKCTVMKRYRKSLELLHCSHLDCLIFIELRIIEKVDIINFFSVLKLKCLQLAHTYLFPKKLEMLHSANVLCIEVALILHISCAGDILESLSRSFARFKTNIEKTQTSQSQRAKITDKFCSTPALPVWYHGCEPAWRSFTRAGSGVLWKIVHPCIILHTYKWCSMEAAQAALFLAFCIFGVPALATWIMFF